MTPVQNYTELPHNLTSILMSPVVGSLMSPVVGSSMVPSPDTVVFTNLTDPSSMSRAMEVACKSGEQAL